MRKKEINGVNPLDLPPKIMANLAVSRTADPGIDAVVPSFAG